MDIYSVQKKHEVGILKKANVVSVGFGYKFKNGEKTTDMGLVVGVREKIDKSQLQPEDLVPQHVDGVPTDVLPVGRIVAQATDPKTRLRPVPPGCSLGHKNITAGTFGCVVEKNGEQFILSNNHVLADSNNGEIGDAILQPAPFDGGTSNHQIATLENFIPISLLQGGGGGGSPTCPFAKSVAAILNVMAKAIGSRHRLSAYQESNFNLVDAAIARPVDVVLLKEILEIGAPTGIKEAELGEAVQKFGRTTSYTTDEVIQLGATVDVEYGAGIARFTNQIMTGPMSEGGDSGSAVLNMNKKVVGLLFAGSPTVTILNPIQKVLELLGATLAV